MITHNNETYKVVVVTPAGRKRYMELLFHYILKQRNVVDEYRIWVNTTNQSDISWFEELKTNYSDFVTIQHLPQNVKHGGNTTIHNFFKQTIDENTIFIRVDDDIVWLEDDYFEKLAKFRIENPEYFLVYGNILNNAVIDYKHQENGITYSKKLQKDAMCDEGWKNPTICEEKHRTFLQNFRDNNLNIYKFEKMEPTVGVIHYNARVSINSICWFGKEFKKFDGNVGNDEEFWLSCEALTKMRKKNCIYGGALCCHFAFWPQREHMDKTDILEKYKELTQR